MDDFRSTCEQLFMRYTDLMHAARYHKQKREYAAKAEVALEMFLEWEALQGLDSTGEPDRQEPTPQT